MDHRTQHGSGTTGSTGVRWISEDTIELIQKGYLNHAVIEELYNELQVKTRGRTVSWVLSETSGVSGLDSSVVGPGGKVLDTLKRLGTRKVVLIAQSAIVRVTATALCLASGVSMKLFATRAEAERYLASARR